MSFYHKELQQTFIQATRAAIMAAGYRNVIPGFTFPIQHLINWDGNNQYEGNKNYSIDARHSIFVRNAELHSDGFNAPDLEWGLIAIPLF